MGFYRVFKICNITFLNLLDSSVVINSVTCYIFDNTYVEIHNFLCHTGLNNIERMWCSLNSVMWCMQLCALTEFIPASAVPSGTRGSDSRGAPSSHIQPGLSQNDGKPQVSLYFLYYPYIYTNKDITKIMLWFTLLWYKLCITGSSGQVQ